MLSLPALSDVHAVSSTPYVYGLPNTTINSSVKPYVVPNTVHSQPNTTINSSVKPYVVPNTVYSQPNTTINSSVKPYVVPNTVYSEPNTTPSSSLNASKTVVTTGAGLPAITAGTFAVPSISASVPKAAQNWYSSLGPTANMPTSLWNFSLADVATGGTASPNPQSPADLNTTATNAQINAQQMQSATDYQNILVNTQTSIFQVQQNAQYNPNATAPKPLFSGNSIVTGNPFGW
jgi:hypothetical protein